jgi:citrate lyase subunit beta/citryl-CoA lyase
MPVRPRRTLLYVPGSHIRALHKARQVPCDTLILDLEDAVAPDLKDAARQHIRHAVEQGFGYREVLVRMNAPSSSWFADDLAMAVNSGAQGIVIPKMRTVKDAQMTAHALGGIDKTGKVLLWLMIETPEAVLEAPFLSRALREGLCPQLAGFIMGTNDLAKETGARSGGGRASMQHWLSTCVLLARSAGVCAIDGVFNAFDDAVGFAAECHQGRKMGFDGKTVIHPQQVSVANSLFSPSAAEIMEAERIILAFSLPENAGRGAIHLDGRMAERLHADMAQRTLDLDHAIKARDVAANDGA